MMIRWAKMLSGKSYYHLPQRLGKLFKPDELRGYFNDLTGKAKWDGLLDSEGIPINQLLDGSACYFLTTIIQKALGHHDIYILDNDDNHLEEFLKICNWLISNQDERGGWDVSYVMGLKEPSRYSAMSQGEGISALLRAWKLTGIEKYFISAKKAYDIMIMPIEKGGTAYYEDHDIYFEEYPAMKRNTVLNGWIFSLFAVYDLFIITGKSDYKRVFEQSFKTLKNNLPVFDSNYWSYYNEEKALSSPFYHDLHISQLEALFIVSGDDTIKRYIEKWKSYKRSLFKRTYAVTIKIYQKLRQAPRVIILK